MQDSLKRSTPWVLAGVLLAAWPFAVGASRGQDAAEAGDAEATRFVDALYRNRIEAVQRTRASEDDLALMTEMLDIAPTLPDVPDAKSALYAAVAGMVDRSRAGYDLALQALDRLAAHNPEHPDAGVSKRLAVYAAWYRGVDRGDRKPVAERYFDELVAAADGALGRGDHALAKRWYGEAGSVQRVNRLDRDFDLRDKLAEARAVERKQEEVQQLQESAKRGALTPAQARRLVVLLALEMGRFEDASVYATLIDDAAFAQGLRAATELGGYDAAQGGGDHPPTAWSRAGNWYATLIDEPGLSDVAKKRTLEMARVGLRGFVEKTTQETLDKARDTILLRQLDERYAEAYGPTLDERDLIRLLDPERHVLSGERFEIDDGELKVKAKSVVHLPVQATGPYVFSFKVRLEGKRVDGLLAVLPVNGRSVTLYIDRSPRHFSGIDGAPERFDQSEGEIRLQREQATSVTVRITPQPGGRVAIGALVDGRRVWDWLGQADQLKKPAYGVPPSPDGFTISVWSDAAFESIKLTRIEEKD